MSTADLAAGAAPARPLGSGRILAVFRLHFANPYQVLLQPLWIYAIIFAMNLAIFAIVDLASGGINPGMASGTQYSGASGFAFFWQLIVATQAMNRTFPFALGFSTTRRDYYLGTLLALGALSIGWSLLLGVLAIVEEATNGWGLGGHMFAVLYFSEDGALARFWYVFLFMLAFAAFGTVAGALFVRWRSSGLIWLAVAIGAIVIGTAALLVVAEPWWHLDLAGGLWRFFGSIGFAGAYPLLLIPFIVLSGVVGWAALRGATGRSGA